MSTPEEERFKCLYIDQWFTQGVNDAGQIVREWIIARRPYVIVDRRCPDNYLRVFSYWGRHQVEYMNAERWPIYGLGVTEVLAWIAARQRNFEPYLWPIDRTRPSSPF